jgi:hypothetical protein
MSALGNWDWIDTWWQRFPKTTLLLIFLSLSLLIIPFAFKSRFLLNGRTLVFYAIATPPLVSLVFWFFTAPDPRFLSSSPNVLLALSAVTLACTCKTKEIWINRGNRYVIPILLFIAFVGSSYWAKRAVNKTDLILLNGFQPIKSVSLVERRTASGLSVYTPVTGDQCFDSPLPCTPYLNENLRLERENGEFPTPFFTTQRK